jgi:hypothetical protein
MRQFLAFSLLSLSLGAGFVLLRLQSVAQPQPVAPPAKPVDPTNEVAALRAEIEQLKGKVPDQSHAMKDVGYHFANLWFAGQQRNWPLAKFYLDETRSHLKWAVRIIPVRKTKAGEVDLRGILEAVDNTLLSEIQKAIEKQDVKQFGDTYKQSIEGCYSCHKASEKPYLRPQIPEQPETRIINFDPETKWPE